MLPTRPAVPADMDRSERVCDVNRAAVTGRQAESQVVGRDAE